MVNSVQSNQSNNGNIAVGTCTFINSQTFGNTNVICFSAGSFADLTVQSITDTAGNMYTLVPNTFTNGGGGGNPWSWMYTCLEIKSAIAGNIVTVTLANNSFSLPFILAINECTSMTAIRVGNVAELAFAGTSASVSLSNTVINDYCVGYLFTQGGSNSSTSGNIGSNIANQLQADANGTLLEDGLSSGGTINITATSASTGFAWIIVGGHSFRILDLYHKKYCQPTYVFSASNIKEVG